MGLRARADQELEELKNVFEKMNDADIVPLMDEVLSAKNCLLWSRERRAWVKIFCYASDAPRFGCSLGHGRYRAGNWTGRCIFCLMRAGILQSCGLLGREG